jgi:nicotinamide-nucleotide amidase
VTGGALEVQVVSALSEQGRTVAVAESLTGGLVASTLVGVPGVSAVFRGGVVSYATDLKHRLLGVDAGLLERNGPVDPEVALQMARGVRDRLGADWGLATTGVAGPGPQDGVPAGRVFVAVVGPQVSAGLAGSVPYARVLRLDLSGGRAEIRTATRDRLLTAFLDALTAGGPSAPGPGPGPEHQVTRHR